MRGSPMMEANAHLATDNDAYHADSTVVHADSHVEVNAGAAREAPSLAEDAVAQVDPHVVALVGADPQAGMPASEARPVERATAAHVLVPAPTRGESSQRKDLASGSAREINSQEQLTERVQVATVNVQSRSSLPAPAIEWNPDHQKIAPLPFIRDMYWHMDACAATNKSQYNFRGIGLWFQLASWTSFVQLSWSSGIRNLIRTFLQV
eukprot:IDg1122t1